MRAIRAMVFAGLATLASPLAAEDDSQPVCPDAMTTLAMNECYSELLAKAEARLATYLEAAIALETENAAELARFEESAAPDLAVVEQMRASQTAFEAYAQGECEAVWESYKQGTIRTVMALACRIQLADMRTRTIWRNWLTYMDSTPPVLPEPEPTL